MLAFTLTARGESATVVVAPTSVVDDAESGLAAAVEDVANAGDGNGEAGGRAGAGDGELALGGNQEPDTDLAATGTTADDADLAAAPTTRRSTTTRPSTTEPGATNTSGDPTTTVVNSTVTTAPSTTRAPTTTTAPTTTAAPRPATIGGKLTFASNGGGVSGLTVKLWSDSNRDGSGETVQRNATTGANGAFQWSMEPACYVIQYVVPSGQQISQGSSTRALCVGDGGRSVNNNIAITDPAFARPSRCEVQISSRSWAGVEIWHPSANWAPSYLFLSSNGSVLHSTANFGPADDIEPNEPSIEWTSDVNGYEESAVYAVAAFHQQGIASAPVTCSRN